MSRAKTIMIQGTASSVGKSVLVAALCRILRQDGYRVAPFKAQNMALNSFVTREGGEIGRAQAVQAEAAGIEPNVHMNPILLKPECDLTSQVIVLGKVDSDIHGIEYWRHTARLLDVVQDSLNRLREEYDVVVIEGAGSPAEINLRDHEIVNMRVAMMFGTPVLLVGDIDRGGVFAALLGTLELLTSEERAYVKGLIINKFRGYVSLLQPGLDMLAERTARPVLGVVPFFTDIHIAQEDSVFLDELPQRQVHDGGIDIVVVKLPHTSNYDDFDPLERAGCTLRFESSPSRLGNPDLIIVPGTKTTVADLLHIRQTGMAEAIVRFSRAGTPVLGICGGFQMLCQRISDPDAVEWRGGDVSGLGLLDATVVFGPEKRTSQVKATVAANSGLLAGLKGHEVEGYEIHSGRTLAQGETPAFFVHETPSENKRFYDGLTNAGGTVVGTYIHGLFDSQSFTAAFLDRLGHGTNPNAPPPEPLSRQQEYDKLAALVRKSLGMEAIYRIIEQGMPEESNCRPSGQKRKETP
ncbi:MAG: cobyric acid synthase [Chloroflexi bacterium]|nr:cobyric acid synthase [Chloroflexota bacterium]